MTLRRLMRVSAALAVPYGALCLCAPQWWLGQMAGIEVTGTGVLLARMYGGQVFGFGTVSALASGTPDSPTRRALITGFAVVDLVSLVLAAYAVATGIVGPAGWLDVAGFTFFATGFGYYTLFPEKAGS